MDNENLYILLDLIFRNGSVKRLANKGVDYNVIAEQTRLAIKDGLVGYSDEKIVLTEKGIDLLRRLEAEYKRTNKEEWIEKDKKSQIKRIDKNTIFVPRQDELTF